MVGESAETILELLFKAFIFQKKDVSTFMVTLKILPFGRVIFESSVIFANTCFPENKSKAPFF